MCKITSYSERSKLSAEQKLKILTNCNTLPHNFHFPGRLEKRGCQRHFQAKCLKHYSWLEYSVMANGGFCVLCMLFGIGFDNIDLGVLVSRQLTNFKKATDELKAWSVRLVVGRPGVHSLSRVIPKDFKKNVIHSFPAWRSA